MTFSHTEDQWEYIVFALSLVECVWLQLLGVICVSRHPRCPDEVYRGHQLAVCIRMSLLPLWPKRVDTLYLGYWTASCWPELYYDS